MNTDTSQDKRLADALLRSLPEIASLISENKQMKAALEKIADAYEFQDGRGNAITYAADTCEVAVKALLPYQQNGSKE